MRKRRRHNARVGAAALLALATLAGCQSGARSDSPKLAYLDSGAVPVMPSDLMYELSLRTDRPAVLTPASEAYGRNDGLLGRRADGGPITFSVAETTVFDHQHTFDGRVEDHFSKRTRIHRLTVPR